MPSRDSHDNTNNRGFASMDEEKQREIASKGGRAAHEKGTAHEFTHEEAVEAGRKGGQARSNTSGQNQESEGSGKRQRGQFTSESAHEAGKKGGRS